MIFLSSPSLSLVKIKWEKNALEGIKMNSCSDEPFEDPEEL